MRELFDETLGRPKCTCYFSRHERGIYKTWKATHWEKDEVDALYLIHYKLIKDSPNKKMDSAVFKEFLRSAFDILGEGIWDKIATRFEIHPHQCISPEAFAKHLSPYVRGRNYATLEDSIKFVWSVYNFTNKSKFKREDILTYMKDVIVKVPQGDDALEMCRDLVDILVKKLDQNKDGALDYRDFFFSIRSNSLLMESMGRVFPPRAARYAFITTFSNKKLKYPSFPVGMDICPREKTVNFAVDKA